MKLKIRKSGEPAEVRHAKLGDLVMIAWGMGIARGELRAPTVGVLEGVKHKRKKIHTSEYMHYTKNHINDRMVGENRTMLRPTDVITLNPAYVLHPAESFAGVDIPVMHKKTLRPVEYGLTGGDNIAIWIGQNDIVEKLRSSSGFKIYADLVESMRKPYSR